MNTYHCVGAVPWSEYCECVYCCGHDRTWHINRIVSADSPERAVELIHNDWHQYPVDMEESPGAEVLLKHLSIQELTEEILMRLAGQPELFAEDPTP